LVELFKERYGIRSVRHRKGLLHVMTFILPSAESVRPNIKDFIYGDRLTRATTPGYDKKYDDQ